MSFIFQCLNRFYRLQTHTIQYVATYQPYYITDINGNRVKNPGFDRISGKLLDIKAEGNNINPAAITELGQLLIDKLRPITIAANVPVSIAIVPKSQAGKVASGLKSVAAKLATTDRRFTLPRQDILTRTRNIEKLAHGGSRHISIHLASISANIPNVTSVPTHHRPESPILLLDDIGTTGTSIEACTTLLYQAGASLVIPIVLGKTA